MAEPTSTAAVAFTLVAGGAAIPVLHILGVPLGVRPDILMWGLMGGLIALIHIQAPPPKAGILQAMLIGMSWIFALLSSALTSGFIAPAVAIMLNAVAPIIPPDITLSMTAFIIGATAQQTLASVTERLNKILKG